MNCLVAEAADNSSAQAIHKDGLRRSVHITTPPSGHPFSEKGNWPWPVLSVCEIRHCLPSQDTTRHRNNKPSGSGNSIFVIQSACGYKVPLGKSGRWGSSAHRSRHHMGTAADDVVSVSETGIANPLVRIPVIAHG